MIPISLTLSLLVVAAGPQRFAVIRQAPAFTLTSQDGKPGQLADYKGKVLLVSFIFTTCNGSCPATTSRMVSIQHKLRRRGHFKDGNVHLLSITLDPARDSPDKLQAYIKLYDIDSASWTMFTGTNDKVNKVIADWRMWVKPAANGQLDHPSRIFLIDPKGQIREIYHLGFLKTDWVVDDIEVLLGAK